MNIPSRLQKLREALGDNRLDAMLISSPENRRYLSGFTGSAGYLLISQSDAVLATDFRYVEQASRQAPRFRVERVTNALDWFVELATEVKGKRIGFEGQHMTVSTHQGLQKAISKADETDRPDLVVTNGLVDKLRATKDEEELGLIARAVEITDGALEAVTGVLRPGVTEGETAWELDKAMRERGAEGVAFPTIVAAGRNGAMAHHLPDDTVVRAGEPVVIDMGARYRGYCADLTRTIVAGEPDDTFRRIYKMVLRAQVEAEKQLRSGMTGAQVDAISRDIIADAGYGENFGHGLGHGVGLAIHEFPTLGAKSNDVVQDGMVFTVEPGIYVADWGGVRIEDVVVLENGRARVLSKAPKWQFDG